MERLDRRTVLGGLTTGLGTALAGCLSERSVGTGTGTDRDGATSTGTPRTDGGLPREVMQVGPTSEWPTWREDGEPAGHVRLFATEAAARGVLDVDGLPDDRRSAVDAFVADSDFAFERLLYVASVGPDTCHSRIEVTSLSVGDHALLGSARAVDTSETDEACGDAITFPAALVRVPFEGEPPNKARITVTDGWGTETEVQPVAVETDPSTLPGHVAPSGDPPAVPASLQCEDADVQRFGAGFDGSPPMGLTTDGWGAFALRVDSREVARGDAVTVTMTNVAPIEGTTGNRHKYNLQVRTEGGWQDVRTIAGDGPYYTDEAVIHQPGEGFEWTVEMTAEGVVSGHPQSDRVAVCPGLPAGRYRFVTWEPDVAVAFDLVE